MHELDWVVKKCMVPRCGVAKNDSGSVDVAEVFFIKKRTTIMIQI